MNAIRVIVFLLAFTGFITLTSAYIGLYALHHAGEVFRPLILQGIALGVGWLCMELVARIPYQWYGRFIPWIVIGGLAPMALLLTPLAIHRGDAVRWVDMFGIVTFQPSELLKLVCVLGIAYLFATMRGSWKRLVCYTAGSVCVLALLSFLQPDFGTFALLLITIAAMALAARLPALWWVSALSVCVPLILAAPFVIPEYVQRRFSVFYDIWFGEISYQERFGSAFHALQNIHAVRSGELFGKGVGYGLGQPGAIPEVTTDSIFALFAAETGFFGVLVVLVLFLAFAFFGYSIAAHARGDFGKLLAVGITTLIIAQAFLNILVILGAPATGIPLLFFSRAGTFIVIAMIGIGIMLNVARQIVSPRGFRS